MTKEQKALKELLDRRLALRNEDRAITKQIKQQRKVGATKSLPLAEYRRLTNKCKEYKKEIRKLRGMIAVYERAGGKTFDQVGELIGVSGSRAKTIIDRHLMVLRATDREIDNG